MLVCERSTHKRSRLLSLFWGFFFFWFKSLEESGTLAEVKAPRLALEKRALEESESEKRGFLILLAYGLKKCVRKKEYGVGELNYFKRRNSNSLRSVASVSVWFRSEERPSEK